MQKIELLQQSGGESGEAWDSHTGWVVSAGVFRSRGDPGQT